MPTTFDLKLALNAKIGSVPLSLHAEAGTDLYSFDGSIQDLDISLADFFSRVSAQFGVANQLPPELNAMHLKIDYLVGQVLVHKNQDGSTKNTELGVSAKFELTITDSFTLVWEFYAASNNSGGQGPTTPYTIGFALDPPKGQGNIMAFADLPLVGKVPGLKDLALTKLGFTYTNLDPAENGGQPVTFSIPSVESSPNPLVTSPADTKNANTYTITGDNQHKTFTLNKKGFSLTVGLENTSTNEQVNNFALPMNLPAATPPTTTPGQSFYSGTTSPPESPAHWIDINKTFGPVSLRKIGLNYSGGEATFGFSAGFAVTAFVLDIEGLTITFPLPLPGTQAGDTVSFDLQGLGLDIKKGALEIGGGFLKFQDPQTKIINYYGEVIVKAGPFGLTALGGYAPDTAMTPASFFLFANINIPLGGPPFFFVTGFAGGFGINRDLLIPTIDQMPSYPLLPHNANAQFPVGGTPKDSLSTVLPALAKIFKDDPGEYWAAAGIQFTSFEMIDSFALLTVKFGVDFEVALLGESSMTFPKGDTQAPLAYIEIDILIDINPALGKFALDGRLTPASSIFDGLCHIYGGFAFYFWFGGEHRGDFVVSLGGYHPAFVKPDNYPTVPRLSFSMGMGPFHIIGQSYFALTPRMMMAGMRVSATWDAGPLKAWFDAGFDFLLSWAPFHYEADAYVHIGISLNVGLFRITVHVGVDLTMWGPKFGGLAHINLHIVHFTIHFGAARAAPPLLDWQDVEKNFLPKNSQSQAPMFAAAYARPEAAAGTSDTTNIIGATVAVGLLQQNAGNFGWILDPEHFVIALDSKVPCNVVQWNGNAAVAPNDVTKYNVDDSSPYLQTPDRYLSRPDPSQPQDPVNKQIWNPELHIGPMGQENITSYFTVTLNKVEEDGSKTPLQDFTLEPVLTDVPQSIWGKKMDTTNSNTQDLNKPQLIPFALTGLLISPIPRHPDVVSDVPLYALIFQQFNQTTFVHAIKAVDPDFMVSGTPSSDGQTLTITIAANPPVSPPPNSPLTNTAFQLSALQDSWIQGRRNQWLDALDAPDSGFQTWSKDEVDLTQMAQKALTDWPMVELLGA